MNETVRPPVIDTERDIFTEKVRNFSGLPEWEVRKHVSEFLPMITRMVVFPDLGPTEPGVVPTGSVTEVDTRAHPDWQKLVRSADMGCGMVLAESTKLLTVEDFIKDQHSLDALRDAIVSERTVSLGGGNHFLDFLDMNGRVGLLLHTGAYRNRQKNLSRIVGLMSEENTWGSRQDDYMKEYDRVIKSAEENRLSLLHIVEKFYGGFDVLSHVPHNTIDMLGSGSVRIYKGVVHVTDNSKRYVLPSSVGDYVDYFIPGPRIGDETLWGLPHGTGRAKPRSQVKGEAVCAVPGLMLPTGLAIPKTEIPSAYRPLTRAEQIMDETGLMKFEAIEDLRQFMPIAYIGHIS